MTILKALKYELAKSSEIARSKQLKLTLLYKPILNILNTFQYKQCSCPKVISNMKIPQMFEMQTI